MQELLAVASGFDAISTFVQVMRTLVGSVAGGSSGVAGDGQVVVIT